MEEKCYSLEESKEFIEATMFQSMEFYKYVLGERLEPDEPITILKRHVEFFDADWIGLIDFDLDVQRWSVIHFYNRNTDSYSETIVEEAEKSEQALRWVKAATEKTYIIIDDVEEIKDSSPEEYAMYKRFKVKSVLAVPYNNCGGGFYVVVNPRRFRHNYPVLNTFSYIITNEIVAQNRRKKMESVVLDDEPNSVKEVNIKLFGDMEIVSKDLRIKKNDISDSMKLIIAYLAMNKGKGFSLEELKNLCEFDTDYLKNYIYRFRKKWKNIRNIDDDKYQLIVTVDKDYMINPELTVNVDVNSALEMVKIIEDTSDTNAKLELLKGFYSMYRGEFLQQLNSDNSFVIGTRYQYASIFQDNMITMLRLMYTQNDYVSIIKYSGDILKICPASVEIHKMRILALCKLGKIDLIKQADNNARKNLTDNDYKMLQQKIDLFISQEEKYRQIS